MAPAPVAPLLDGPPSPAERAAQPDPQLTPAPEPQVEPILPGGPNKPYAIGGFSYAPLTEDLPWSETGLASWYGRKFHGRRTASGEIYNMHAFTAAHRTLPIPSYALVRNPKNGMEVVVRINDRGPFVRDRVLDLSWAAAVKLDVHRGVSPVELRRLTAEDIRARRPAPQPAPGRVGAVADVVAPAGPAAVASAVASASANAARPLPPAPPQADALAARAYTRAASGYWVQLGAFAKGEGAHALQQQLAEWSPWVAPLLAVFRESGLHKLQAGPYASRDEARQTLERLRSGLKMVPMVVERR